MRSDVRHHSNCVCVFVWVCMFDPTLNPRQRKKRKTVYLLNALNCQISSIQVLNQSHNQTTGCKVWVTFTMWCTWSTQTKRKDRRAIRFWESNRATSERAIVNINHRKWKISGGKPKTLEWLLKINAENTTHLHPILMMFMFPHTRRSNILLAFSRARSFLRSHTHTQNGNGNENGSSDQKCGFFPHW